MSETYFEITRLYGDRWLIEGWLQDREAAILQAKELARDGLDIRLTAETFDPETNQFSAQRIFYTRRYRQIWQRPSTDPPRRPRPIAAALPKSLLERIAEAIGFG
jgi:hypothetical protein